MNTIARQPRIALVTSADPANRRAWSGTLYFLAEALQRHCGQVTSLGPVACQDHLGRLVNQFTRRLLHRTYNYTASLLTARQYARLFTQRLAEENFDVIFAPDAPVEIALLPTSLPIVYLNDATFTQLRDYHPEHCRLLPASARQAAQIDRLALHKARLVIMSSSWAAQSAVQDVGVDPSRVAVAPFGANIERIPSSGAARQRRLTDRCRLLFMGKNWHWKGGGIALETLRALARFGVPVDLTVCGCAPPTGIMDPHMHVLDYLDKRKETQRLRLEELFRNFDFLLLPTRADCTPVVFCEAAAFGLPVISTDTGGVAGVICDGENGILLPYDARGVDYARVIAEVFRDPARYQAMVEASRRAYDERLNWDAWGHTVNRLVRKVLGW